MMRTLAAMLPIAVVGIVCIVDVASAAEGPAAVTEAGTKRKKTPEQILVEQFTKNAKTKGNESTWGGVKWIRDIAYRQGGNEKWKLDVVYPEAHSTHRRAGIVIVHGGGWRGNDKSMPRFAGIALMFAKQGYVCVNVNYRLSGEAVFPAAFEDVRCAVRWFRAEAAKYSLDPNRIGAVGTSSGGHLVAMLGLVEGGPGLGADEPYGKYSSRPQAVAAICAPTDLKALMEDKTFSKANEVVTAFLTGPAETLPARQKAASPITYVSRDAPPFLVIHGVEDSIVPISQSDNFVKALKGASLEGATYLRVPGAGHGVYQHESGRPAVRAFFARTLMGKTLKSRTRPTKTPTPRSKGL